MIYKHLLTHTHPPTSTSFYFLLFLLLLVFISLGSFPMGAVVSRLILHDVHTNTTLYTIHTCSSWIQNPSCFNFYNNRESHTWEVTIRDDLKCIFHFDFVFLTGRRLSLFDPSERTEMWSSLVQNWFDHRGHVISFGCHRHCDWICHSEAGHCGGEE